MTDNIQIQISNVRNARSFVTCAWNLFGICYLVLVIDQVFVSGGNTLLIRLQTTHCTFAAVVKKAPQQGALGLR